MAGEVVQLRGWWQRPRGSLCQAPHRNLLELRCRPAPPRSQTGCPDPSVHTHMQPERAAHLPRSPRRSPWLPRENLDVRMAVTMRREGCRQKTTVADMWARRRSAIRAVPGAGVATAAALPSASGLELFLPGGAAAQFPPLWPVPSDHGPVDTLLGRSRARPARCQVSQGWCAAWRLVRAGAGSSVWRGQ